MTWSLVTCLDAPFSRMDEKMCAFEFPLKKRSVRAETVVCQCSSLRSCPLPISPLCLSREEGVIFSLSSQRSKEAKKKKKKNKAWSQVTVQKLAFLKVLRFSFPQKKKSSARASCSWKNLNSTCRQVRCRNPRSIMPLKRYDLGRRHFYLFLILLQFNFLPSLVKHFT